MNFLERINRDRILIKYWFVLNQCKKIYLNEDPIIFLNRGGIGNIINILPLIKKFSNPVLVSNNKTVKETLNYFGYKTYCMDEIKKGHQICIVNWLNQNKDIIKKIIELKIPYRVGHDFEGFNKWRKLFNYRIKMDNYINEINSNLRLYEPWLHSNVNYRNK